MFAPEERSKISEIGDGGGDDGGGDGGGANVTIVAETEALVIWVKPVFCSSCSNLPALELTS